MDAAGDLPTFDRWRTGAIEVASGGLRIAAYDTAPDRGDLPVVTYLHGYPSSSHDIATVLPHLAGTVRVVTLDLPGFGASEKPDGHPYSIHACADAVEATWAALGIERTILWSHDYGVSVGQELVARALDGALAVAVAAAGWSNGGLYPDLHRPTAGQAMLIDPEQGPALAAGMEESLFSAGIGVTWGTRVAMDPATVHEIWASMDHDGGVVLLHQLLHYVGDRRANAERWANALERSGLPQAFVWGDLDPVSGAHMIARVEERVDGALIRRLADVGHWPPLEAPDEVAAGISALVAQAG